MRRANSRNLRARRGVALVYGVIAILVLIGLLSLAVDLGHAHLAKSELQVATDAAARYGAKGLYSGPATVKSMVINAAADNKVDGTPLVIDPVNDIEFGIWSSTSKTFTPLSGAAQSSATAIRVTGKRLAARGTGISLLFGALIGQRTCDLHSSCIVTTASNSNDVFLIQDITTSFKEELPDAKVADQALLDKLYAGGGDGGRLAIAVHTGWGKTLAPLTGITANYTYLTSIVSSIQVAGTGSMPVASGTDIASGFDEAIAAYTASGYVAPTGTKNVILVSDGDPTADKNGKHPTLTDAQLLSLAQTRADTLWSRGVNVYVVFMDSTNNTTGAANLKTLIRGTGEFIKVDQPQYLPSALKSLTDKIIVPTIVQ